MRTPITLSERVSTRIRHAGEAIALVYTSAHQSLISVLVGGKRMFRNASLSNDRGMIVVRDSMSASLAG